MKNYGKRGTCFHEDSKTEERELEKALFQKRNFFEQFNYRFGAK